VFTEVELRQGSSANGLFGKESQETTAGAWRNVTGEERQTIENVLFIELPLWETEFNLTGEPGSQNTTCTCELSQLRAEGS
jgi:hypothetical protein